MKKIAVLLLALTLILGAMVGTFSASAATKQYTMDDVINKVSEANIYKYFKGDIANLSKTVDLTDTQINDLYTVAEEFVALNLPDKGADAGNYTPENIKAVVALMDEASQKTGYTYTLSNIQSAQNVGDVVVKLYDRNNKVIYTYDGDVKKTGADQTALFVTVSLLGCALLAAAVFVTKAKKARA